jgi:hypothetical protein
MASMYKKRLFAAATIAVAWALGAGISVVSMAALR